MQIVSHNTGETLSNFLVLEYFNASATTFITRCSLSVTVFGDLDRTKQHTCASTHARRAFVTGGVTLLEFRTQLLCSWRH